MRFTLNMVCKASYVLFVSQVNNNILIVFRKIKNLIKKAKNSIIVRL